MDLITFSNVLSDVFVERPNRFLVKLESGRLAHLHDPGRLKELLIPGRKLFLREVKSPSRKTNLDVLAVDIGYPVFIHSGYHSLIAERLIPYLFGGIEAKEVKFGGSRIDFLLSDGRPLEVKGCTLLKDKVALFPDAPTERGTRHVLELANHGGALLFLVFHPPARVLKPNCETDPRFCEAMKLAIRKGVEMKAAVIRTSVSEDSLRLEYVKEIPVSVGGQE